VDYFTEAAKTCMSNASGYKSDGGKELIELSRRRWGRLSGLWENRSSIGGT
jgi:hypothetical protein